MAKKLDKEITTLITHKKPKAVVSEKFRGISKYSSNLCASRF